MIPEKNTNQSVDLPNCKSHKASHVPRGQGHIRLHQVKVTSGHIKSQQVTSCVVVIFVRVCVNMEIVTFLFRGKRPQPYYHTPWMNACILRALSASERE